jgi:hypothetical protein
MKFMKYVLALAIAFCAITSVSNAQVTVFIGGGSSGLALELGQAAVVDQDSITGANTACIWTRKTGSLNSGSTMNAVDNRFGPTTESGNVWVVWGRGTGTCLAPTGSYSIYMYTNLDSVLGDRGYFEVDPGAGGCAAGPGYCQNLILVAADSNPSTPDNILNANPTAGHTFTDTAGGIPSVVVSALNNHHWNFAGTDIRPEDAKYATFRALSACNAAIYRQPFDQILRSTSGLGYSNGNSFTDDFSAGKSFHLLDFNISGNDPINTSGVVPNFAVSVVGAQPIIVAVGPLSGGTNTGVQLATDVPAYVLSNFMLGVLGRATDLLGPTQAWPVSALVREPLSGTYNTFEYSNINSSQFHNSQDQFNCGPTPGNPLHLVSMNGAFTKGANAFRRRVIGTGQMTAQLQAGTESDERIGYFFWGAANIAGLTNVKYLTVNGVDPIQNTYSNGVMPASGATGDPCSGTVVGCSAVTFKGLNSGAYPIWSALRVVSQSPVPAGITSLIAAAQTLNSAQFDFVPLSSLNVWRSHYYMPAIGINTAANGGGIASGTDLCNPAVGALPEQGGDAGGAIILKQANADFCSDYNNNTGLVNKTE